MCIRVCLHLPLCVETNEICPAIRFMVSDIDLSCIPNIIQHFHITSCISFAIPIATFAFTLRFLELCCCCCCCLICSIQFNLSSLTSFSFANNILFGSVVVVFFFILSSQHFDSLVILHRHLSSIPFHPFVRVIFFSLFFIFACKQCTQIVL